MSGKKPALGYAEILGKLAKITGSMVDRFTPQIAGEKTFRAAVWSLAGRAVVAERSAALLSVVNEGWCDSGRRIPDKTAHR